MQVHHIAQPELPLLHKPEQPVEPILPLPDYRSMQQRVISIWWRALLAPIPSHTALQVEDAVTRQQQVLRSIRCQQLL